MMRTELLKKLINMEASADIITDELNKIPWDSDELVVLTKDNILNALNNYLANKICSTEIENWANTIENREDIGRENDNKTVINQVLYELANPYLTEELTIGRAELLIAKLKK